MRLLVDMSSIMHRMAHKMQDLTDRHGNKTNVVFGTLRSLEKLASELEPTELVACWDGGSDRRKTIYPEYKEKRPRDEEWYRDYRRQVMILSRVLSKLPVIQVWQPGIEADDVIAEISRFIHLEQAGIVTTDEDLFQLATNNHHIIHPTERKRIKLELRPKQYIAYKVLVGDSSDNIKGIDQVGPVTAKKLLSEHKSLKKIMRWCRDGNKLGRMTYEQALPIVKRNLNLIKLDGSLLTHEEQRSILEQYKLRRLDCKLDQAGFKQELKRMSMASLLVGLRRYLLPFRTMEREGGTTAKARARALEAPFSNESEIRQEAQEAYSRKLKKPVDGYPSGWRRRFLAAVGGSDQSVGQSDSTAVLADVGRAAGNSSATALSSNDGDAREAGQQRSSMGTSRAGRNTAARVQTSGARSEGGAYTKKLKKLAPKILNSEIMRARRLLRREDALSVLHNLQLSADFQEWIKNQPISDLRRLRCLIATVIAYEDFIPSKYDMRWLRRLHAAYCGEEPDWMRNNGMFQD